jgi:flagellar biosynthetic protein FliQ
VSSDQATALVAVLFRITLYTAGPVLLTALTAGVLVGILQTATQINESSISFLVKVVAVSLVIMLLGPQLASSITDYARASLRSVADVVR